MDIAIENGHARCSETSALRPRKRWRPSWRCCGSRWYHSDLEREVEEAGSCGASDKWLTLC